MSPRKFDRVMIDLEAGRHLKLRPLDDSEFRCFVAGVLPIAAKAPIRGCLLIGERHAEPDDIVVQSGVRKRSAGASALRKLRELGLVFTDDELGCERVHDFEEWNPAPKKDSTGAERQARYRAKLASRNGARNGGGDGVTHVTVTPTEVEEKGIDPLTPVTGGNEKVVTFARRRVPGDRLAMAERLLAEFNEVYGTSHGAYTGRNEASESLRRIIGALTDHPDVSEEQWGKAIRWRLTDPFWEGKPDTGVVFGPKVVSANLASVMQQPRRPMDDPALRAKVLG